MFARDETSERIKAVACEIARHCAATERGHRLAAGSVASCIEMIRDSVWPEVAWRFSALSSDGSPLQFAFSAADDRLRFTAEVAGPEVATAARLRAAAALAERLGGPVVSPKRLRFWETLQSKGPLRWGTWLGVTHDGTNARPKLYVEVPRSLREMAETARLAPAVVRSSRLMMIGFDCRTRSEEYYFRQPQMEASELAIFRRFCDAAPHCEMVLEAFSELSGFPVRAALHWMNFGYSVSPGAEGFVLFVRSRSLRDVAKIRAQYAACERRFGKTQSAYNDCLGRLPAQRLPDHEIVSVIGRPTGDVELRVGVSAVALARL